MEELLDKMEISGISTMPPKNSKSDHIGLYKNWGKIGNQEERRRDMLETQKSKRNSKLDVCRGILDLVNVVEDNIFEKKSQYRLNDQQQNKQVSMERLKLIAFRHDVGMDMSHYRPRVYVSGFNGTSRTYGNVLMMSEWMIEKPEDFAENWYITPCPKGVRMLVISNWGRTKCYTKYGQFRFEMASALPGGNHRDSGYKKDKLCVLDCFYQESTNTMFVLDFLAWNNHSMTDCEAEFRNFWLQSQFAENQSLGFVSKTNKCKFVLLPKIPCIPDEINKFMMTYPYFENNVPELDGLLFYHKKAHYVSGETPLVGWLFPFMVQELLGSDVTVHQVYKLQKPLDYVNQTEYIKEFEEKISKKKDRRSNRHSNDSSSMDTADEMAKDNKDNKTEMEADNITDNNSAAELLKTKSVGTKASNTSDMDAEELPKIPEPVAKPTSTKDNHRLNMDDVNLKSKAME